METVSAPVKESINKVTKAWVRPDLNRPHRVTYRRINQAMRRLFWRLFPEARHELSVEIARIAHKGAGKSISDMFTPEDNERLNQLHWRLGTASVYRYTPEQEQALNELAEQVLNEILADERKEKATRTSIV